MDTDVKPVLIDAEALARMMDVSERTLWRWVSRGELPQPLRIGGSTRWRLAEINDWIERGCPGGR